MIMGLGARDAEVSEFSESRAPNPEPQVPSPELMRRVTKTGHEQKLASAERFSAADRD